MEQRRLGGSGLVVSAIGLGCNNFGRPDSATEQLDGTRAVVDAALECGITVFDVADAYGSPRGRSEELLGVALAGRRDQAVIATKFGADMAGANGADFGSRASRRYVRRAVESSLRRLSTDWIDLYQLHGPDPHTPIAETLSVLDDLVTEGKIRYVGHCNLRSWQIADASWTARTAGLVAPISAQDRYSLLDRQAEQDLVPACEHFGLGLLPYLPLASGLLSGKYRREVAPPPGSRLSRLEWVLARAPWDRIETLRLFAERRGLSPPQVAISALAAQPTVASVIAGATTSDQVRSNASADEWDPTEEDLAEIDDICPPGRN